MKKCFVCAFVGAAFFCANASAQDSVPINGITWVCDNQCVVIVNPDGTYTVRDSEGGRIHARLPPREK